MKRFFSLLFFTSLLLSSSAFAADNDLYYLSTSGYLIKLDVQSVAETGQVAAGLMPWGAASCDGHIYFTDFASDEVIDFSPSEKSLRKAKLSDPTQNIGVQEVSIYSKEVENAVKKSGVQTAFERVIKQKPKPVKYDPNLEPLPIAAHNKKAGLGAIACNSNYVYVVSTLKNKVEVFSVDKLKRVATLTVGERPSNIAISPNGETLAVSSIALNTVFLTAANGDFAKKAQVEVAEGPTELVWLNNDELVVMDRGADSLSILSASGLILKTVNLGAPLTTMNYSRESNKLYVLDGTDRKVFVVNPNDFTFESKEVSESLNFPNLLLSLNKDELLIGSEPDGRLLLVNAQSFEAIKKIQTNLSPKVLVKLTSDQDNKVSPDLKPISRSAEESAKTAKLPFFSRGNKNIKPAKNSK